MTSLGTRTIRSKLIWLTTAISVAAVILVSVVTAMHDYQSRRRALEKELTAVSAILVANLEASLMFNDRETTREILMTLFSNGIVQHARVLDANGGVVAGLGTEVALETWPESGLMTAGSVGFMSVPVVRYQERLGTLQITASLRDLDDALRDILLITIAVLVSAILLAWLLAYLFGRHISKPIEHLVGTMERVSEDHDFSRRAHRTTDDETGALIDGFNEMIEKIESYNAEVAWARDRAEEANRSKTRFLATMSHELRTPLNAIMGFSEVIRDQLLGDQATTYRKYAGDIHDSAGFLLDLINDLLDMSRLDSDAYALDESEVRAEDLIRNCARMLHVRAQAKDLRLELSFGRGITLLRADDRALRQVILNLVGNAIKFTPEGGRIEVRGEIVEPSGDYIVQVIDDGPGIATEDIDRVLEPFEQVRSHLSREHGGSGLGLAISRSIVRLHGGELKLFSTVGEGTMAQFNMPAARVIAEDQRYDDPKIRPLASAG
jgi:signal transduction histidine kinase